MPRLLFSAPFKSSGKTTLSIGVLAALHKQGIKVHPFKKGPDYIDPMWLSRAGQHPCYNIDFNTMSDSEIISSMGCAQAEESVALIEANMGLFDSVDIEGKGSNATMAKLLKTPVILIINVQGATRSIVPIILGFQSFDSDLNIAGIILNNVGGKRHERRLREVIAHYCTIPVVGAVQRDSRLHIEERHLGLIPSNEEEKVDERINLIAEIIAEQVDLPQLVEIAQTAEPLQCLPSADISTLKDIYRGLRLGIAMDEAFGFYYQSDLDHFRSLEVELIPFSPIHDSKLPEGLDALFIGGGFPETHLAQLESNHGMRREIHLSIESGTPCYAECGGLMYLSEAIEWQGDSAKMVGIIPATARVQRKPVGHGYATAHINSSHPWYSDRTTKTIAAHEFHYSYLDGLENRQENYGYQLTKGAGLGEQHDGFIYKNLLANYLHLRHSQQYPWIHQFLDFILTQRLFPQ